MAKIEYEINGKGRGLLNLNKHNFSLKEKAEMLFKLFGFNKISIFGYKNAEKKNENTEDFEKFTTSVQFDFNWLVNGTYTIDELTDDEDLRSILKTGLAKFTGKVAVTTTAQKPEKVIDISAPEAPKIAEAPKAAIPEKSKHMDTLKGIVSAMATKLVDELKTSHPGISENELKAVEKEIDAHFNETAVSEIVDALNNDSVNVAEFVETNEIFKNVRADIAKIVEAKELPQASYHEHLIKPISTRFDHCGNVIGSDSIETMVATRVNLHTIPMEISPEVRTKIIERLHNSLFNQDVDYYIKTRQSMPLFIFTHFNDENDFTIQSYQPCYPNITFRLTATQTIPLD